MSFLQKSSVIFTLLIMMNLPSAIAAPSSMAKQTLTINQQPLTVEVAKTAKERQQGLMGRKSLTDGSGMLFDFGEDVIPCFWMKNTYIPLSIAFIDKHYIITQIASLTPYSLDEVCSQSSIRYAIEVPLGWFDRQKITKNMVVKGITHR